MKREYLDIKRILSYNKRFNFINGTRSIGKTYSTIKFLIEICLNKNIQFAYILRRDKNRSNKTLIKAVSKVCKNEFPNLRIKGNNREFYLDNQLISQCLTLDESEDIKRNSYDDINYILFDEYMVSHNIKYVDGWQEPNLLLSIYHTIDRGSDRVTFIGLGNNINFYNPYHLHPAFQFKNVPQGKIYLNKNSLFYNADLRELKSGFSDMVNGTTYGDTNFLGVYSEQEDEKIAKMPAQCMFLFSIQHNKEIFGVNYSLKDKIIYIAKNKDKSCPIILALDKSDVAPNNMYFKYYKNSLTQCFYSALKNGKIYYTSHEIKEKLERGVLKLIF